MSIEIRQLGRVDYLPTYEAMQASTVPPRSAATRVAAPPRGLALLGAPRRGGRGLMMQIRQLGRVDYLPTYEAMQASTVPPRSTATRVAAPRGGWPCLGRPGAAAAAS